MSSVRAYAKINLGLRILRKREDGFHDIETVFHRIDIFDELSFSPAPSVSVSSDSPDLPPGDENLCVRAARLLQSKAGTDDGAHITLKKHIPIGGGLGGGSADAAETLLRLNEMWRLDLGYAELVPLALELGSDVPYFLQNGSAYATGRGEILEYFSLDLPYWILVVNPGIHISTAWAYRNAKIPTTQRPPLKELLLEHLNDARRYVTLIQNDFEYLVLKEHPEIAHANKMMYDLGAEFAQLSGSGSSVYALFSNADEVKNAAETFRSSYQVFITPPGFKPIR